MRCLSDALLDLLDKHEGIRLREEIRTQPPLNFLDLPDEMMVEIFKRVARSSDNPTTQLRELASVCNRFRSIIYLHPHQLWSKIDLSGIRDFDKNEMETMLTILTPNRGESEVVNHVCALRHLVLGFGYGSNRLLGLETNEIHYDCLKKILDLSASTLESLEIYKQDTPYYLDDRALLDFIFKWMIVQYQEFKRLKELHISEVPGKIEYAYALRHVIDTKKLPNLSKLSLHRCKWLIVPTLFRSFCNPTLVENLRELDLLLDGDVIDVVPFQDIAPQLQVLRISNATLVWRRQSGPIILHGSPFKNLLELHVELLDIDKRSNSMIYLYLAGGSPKLSSLCVYSFALALSAVLATASEKVQEFTMSDFGPLHRMEYPRIIQRWSRTLKVLGLSEIKDPLVIEKCMESLYMFNRQQETTIPIGSSDHSRQPHSDLPRDYRYHALTHLHFWDTLFWRFEEIVHGIIEKSIRLEQLTIIPPSKRHGEEAITYRKTLGPTLAKLYGNLGEKLSSRNASD